MSERSLCMLSKFRGKRCCNLISRLCRKARFDRIAACASLGKRHPASFEVRNLSVAVTTYRVVTRKNNVTLSYEHAGVFVKLEKVLLLNSSPPSPRRAMPKLVWFLWSYLPMLA